MGMKNWTAEELREMAEILAAASKTIKQTADLMENVRLSHIVVQANTAASIYAPALLNLSNMMNTECMDQFNSIKYNRPARWEMNQRKIESRYTKNKKQLPEQHATRPTILPDPAEKSAESASLPKKKSSPVGGRKAAQPRR